MLTLRQDATIVIPDELSNVQVDSITSDAVLDLPLGWDPDQSVRHQKYDPTTVAILALILACGIAATIAACVWRSNFLRSRRLKDKLEHAEKGQMENDKSTKRKKKKRRRRKREQDEDSEDEKADSDAESTRSSTASPTPTKSKNSRPARVFGKSSALWRANTRLAARFRRTPKSSDPSQSPSSHAPSPATGPASADPDDTNNTPSTFLPPPTSQYDPGTPTTTGEADTALAPIVGDGDENSPRHASHHLPSVSEPGIVSGGPLTVNTPAIPPEASEVPRIVVVPPSPHSASIPLLLLPPEEGVPSSSPPAYRRGRRRVRLAEDVARQSGVGKRPVSGREEEYDERDLELWRRLELSAAAAAAAIASEEPEPAEIEFETEELEPDEDVALTRRSVTRGHVATDDKIELERLRSLREDPHTSSSASSAPLDGAAALEPPSTPHPNFDSPFVDLDPQAPSLELVEDWELERHLEEHSIGDDDGATATRMQEEEDHDGSPSYSLIAPADHNPSNPSSPLISANHLPGSSLPPPPAPLSTLPAPPSPIIRSHSTLSHLPLPPAHPRLADDAYTEVTVHGLGGLWDGLGGGVRSPSLPDGEDDEGETMTFLVASAPPLEDEDEEEAGGDERMASAPPIWDHDGDEEEELEAGPSAPPPPPPLGEMDNRDSGEEHGSSLRLSTQKRVGVGLPKYEP